MAASSVTGTGPGESGGLQKPENHCGCGCGGSQSKSDPKPPPKRVGCRTGHRLGYGVARSTHKSGSVGSRSCF